MFIINIPRHIAIIMDGNGRWAKKRALPRHVGHVAGAKVIKDIVVHCNELGVEILTLFAFSTENWNRPKIEVRGLISLIRSYLKNMDSYIKFGVKVVFFGDLSIFGKEMLEEMALVEKKFSQNSGMTFAIAINYGGRSEIVNAAKQIGLLIKQGDFDIEQIDEQFFKNFLYTRGYPDVDLLIRTGSEFRVSNFLLWQIAYAELVFMGDVLWPDFKPEHIDLAIKQYCLRNRTYGKVN